MVRVYSEARSERGLEKLSGRPRNGFSTEAFLQDRKKIAKTSQRRRRPACGGRKAPQAEALAVSWIERRVRFGPRCMPCGGVLRPRRCRLACLLFVHVMFGANGMVVYRQKRAEYQDLQKQVAQMKQENERCTQQIEALEKRSEGHRAGSARTVALCPPGGVRVRSVHPAEFRPARHSFSEKVDRKSVSYLPYLCFIHFTTP